MPSDFSHSQRSQKWASQLDAIFERCEGAYSDLTLSGYRRDLEIFADWCNKNGRGFLPADPRSVAQFFNEQLVTCSYATIRRRASAIRFAHVLSDLPSPIEQSDVFLAMRRAVRLKGRRPSQSLGLTQDLLYKMLEACPETLAGSRDAALLSVGYDTLCRSSELSWMRLEDVQIESSRIYIPRSKNDPFGDGRFRLIKDTTLERIMLWLDGSQINDGALFRGLHTGSVSSSNLDTSSIRRIVKSVARRAGLHEQAKGLSGHSMRVGAAQDLMKEGATTIEIMTAGGWKNSAVMARYVENSPVGWLDRN
ncbi:MAG: tyrosine-type recombinase/integrase [Pseudomonadota bacterium]